MNRLVPYLLLTGMAWLGDVAPDAHRGFQDGKTNFVDSFRPEQLSSFVKRKKFVFVLFHKQPPNFGNLNAIIFSLATLFEDKEVFFLQVDQREMNPDLRKSLGLHRSLLPMFFVYGVPKEFHLNFKVESARKWIDQIISADVVTVKNREQIPKLDAHFVVVANQTFYDKNPTHFRVLAKLVSPVSLFVGLSDHQIGELAGSEVTGKTLICVRRFDGVVLDVPASLTLPEKAQRIHEGEFPDVLECSPKAKDLILQQTLPVLVYYFDSTAPGHSDQLAIVLEEAAKFKEYFKILKIDTQAPENQCRRFFKPFLALRGTPSLRILSTHDKIRRFNFVGEISGKILHLFFHNYLENNLKPFRIHQHLRPRQSHKGLLVANQKIYLRNAKRGVGNGLYYVYSDDSPEFEKQLSELRVVRSVFRQNRSFKVYLFDHRMNDLDGRFHPQSPFVVLVLVTGQILYFEGEIQAEALVRFVSRHAPFLKLSEPEDVLLLDENL